MPPSKQQIIAEAHRAASSTRQCTVIYRQPNGKWQWCTGVFWQEHKADVDFIKATAVLPWGSLELLTSKHQIYPSNLQEPVQLGDD